MQILSAADILTWADDFPTKEYGLAIDIESVIRQEGIDLNFWPFSTNIIGALIEEIPKHWTIVCNTEMTKGAQRYTMAHELVHYKLHRNIIPSATLWCYKHGNRRYTLEKQADKVAAAILIPERTLRLVVDNCTWTIDQLADAYQVSNKAMAIRLMELGILRPNQRRTHYERAH